MSTRWIPCLVLVAALAPRGLPAEEAAAEEAASALPMAGLVGELPVRREQPSPAHAGAVLVSRDLPEGTLIVRFEVGRADDGGLIHITRLALTSLLEASRTVDPASLQSRLQTRGATLDLEVGLHHSEVVLTAPADAFEGLAREVTQLLLAPRLHPRRFDRVRDRVALSVPRPASETALRAAVAAAALGDSRYYEAGEGADRVVRSINFGEVMRHLRRNLSPADATVVMVGPFDADRMARHLRRFRGGRPRGLEVRHLELPKDEITRSPVDLQLAAWPVDLGEPELVAGARVLSSILQRRVTDRLRAAGLGVPVEVHVVQEPWLDFILLTVPVGAVDATVLKGHLREASAALVHDAPVDAAELDAARTVLRSRLARAADDAGALARELLLTEVGGVWYGGPVDAALASLDPHTVNDLARRWIRRDAVVRVRFASRISQLDPTQKARAKEWRR